MKKILWYGSGMALIIQVEEGERGGQNSQRKKLSASPSRAEAFLHAAATWQDAIS